MSTLPANLVERIVAAEEAIYAQPDDAMVNWDSDDLRHIFEDAGLPHIEIMTETNISEWRISALQIERWFNVESQSDRLTFAQHCRQAGLNTPELELLKRLFQQQLVEKVVPWKSTVAYLATQKI